MKRFFCWGLIFFSLLLAVNTHTYHASGRFDSYHEGESLGPGVSVLHGQKLYRDVLFFHGALQDPLDSALAFRFFGKSIGAERTVQSLVKVATWVFLAIFLAQLFHFDRRYAYAVLFGLALVHVSFSFNVFISSFLKDPAPEAITQAFLKWEKFFSPLHRILIIPRDVATFLFLMTALLMRSSLPLQRPGARVRARFWFYSFLFSLIPVASIGLALDRGVYLLMAYFLLFPGVWFFLILPLSRKDFLLCSLTGLLTGGLFLSAEIQCQWWAFLNSLTMLFRTSEFTAKVPYPIEQAPFGIVILLIAFNVFWLIFRFIQVWHSRGKAGTGGVLGCFTRQYFPEVVMGLLSVLLFINAIERSDWEHVCYSMTVTYILTADIMIKDWISPFLKRKVYSVLFSKILFSAVFMGCVCCGYRFFEQGLLEKNFPLQVPDSTFISPPEKAVTRFLKTRLKPEDDFFTLTSEASWYYFLDKPCPTRFPYIWVASSEPYQKEVVKSLQQKNVKYVLYKDQDWSYTVDDISNEIRFPLIVEFLRENYIPDITIEGHEIWKLKEIKKRLERTS